MKPISFAVTLAVCDISTWSHMRPSVWIPARIEDRLVSKTWQTCCISFFESATPEKHPSCLKYEQDETSRERLFSSPVWAESSTGGKQLGVDSELVEKNKVWPPPRIWVKFQLDWATLNEAKCLKRQDLNQVGVQSGDLMSITLHLQCQLFLRAVHLFYFCSVIRLHSSSTIIFSVMLSCMSNLST